jgi:HAMP domain-containing protein
MDPRVERDLETVDRALAGHSVDLGSGDLAELALLLRDERPEPEPRWAAELDERAAAGFPRGGGSGRRKSSWFSGGGWMAPAGALATLAIVVVAVTSTGGDSGPMSSQVEGGPSDSMAQTTTTPATEAEGGANGELLPISPGGASKEDSSATAYVPSSQRFDRLRSDGAIAPGTENRKVERNTQLSLSAKPEDVRSVSDEVITITRSLGGIVASSQVSETADGATATLDLTLPTRNVDAALDQMTELADVDSLNETSTDITKPFVSAQDELRDAEARRRELLEALGNATTDAEVEALTLQIADARREISRAEASFERIAAKARLSSLSVSVSSDPNASDERTLGDWLDDAVDVLRGIAGVLLVSAAILIPLGLIAGAIAWVTMRLRRRSREKTLD